MSVVTQVQTVVQRLSHQPDEHVTRTPLITWPFLPKVQPPQTTKPEPTVTTSVRPPVMKRRENLLRSSSLVKIRQFCNQSCDALRFLHVRRSALQTTVNHGLVQAKECIFVIAVYLAVSLLALQLGTCFYMLAGKPAPPGLMFMIVSLFAIMGTFSKIIVSFTNRKSRQTKRAMHSSRKTK